MSSTATIYGLRDPRSMELRYVGMTVKPERRVKEHVRDSARRPNCHRSKWIASLVREGLRPELIELETVPHGERETAEIFWVGYMKALGARLTNATNGGNGANNWPQELRRRRGETLRGRRVVFSPEHRAALATMLRARAADPEWRRKASEAAKCRCAKDPQHMRERGLKGHAAAVAAGPFDGECVICGAAFVSKTKVGKFCGAYCRGKDYRARHGVIANV